MFLLITRKYLGGVPVTLRSWSHECLFALLCKFAYTWSFIGGCPCNSTVAWHRLHRYSDLLAWRKVSAIILNFHLQREKGKNKDRRRCMDQHQNQIISRRTKKWQTGKLADVSVRVMGDLLEKISQTLQKNHIPINLLFSTV